MAVHIVDVVCIGLVTLVLLGVVWAAGYQVGYNHGLEDRKRWIGR